MNKSVFNEGVSRITLFVDAVDEITALALESLSLLKIGERLSGCFISGREGP